MPAKQHTGFKNSLLAILFLLFNCICVAAPVVRSSAEKESGVVPISLNQFPAPGENEEDSHNTTFTYTNHCPSISERKQDERLQTAVIDPHDLFVPAANEKWIYNNADGIPLPGYYRFLFRYTLF